MIQTVFIYLYFRNRTSPTQACTIRALDSMIMEPSASVRGARLEPFQCSLSDLTQLSKQTQNNAVFPQDAHTTYFGLRFSIQHPASDECNVTIITVGQKNHCVLWPAFLESLSFLT